MNNWTIRTRLFVLIVLMMAGSLAIGAAGLNSVYLDRVVPLRDLKLISDLYAVNIVDASHKARDGGMAPTEAALQVLEAQQRIQQIWKAYLATSLIDDEKRLIAQIEL